MWGWRCDVLGYIALGLVGILAWGFEFAAWHLCIFCRTSPSPGGVHGMGLCPRRAAQHLGVLLFARLTSQWLYLCGWHLGGPMEGQHHLQAPGPRGRLVMSPLAPTPRSENPEHITRLGTRLKLKSKYLPNFSLFSLQNPAGGLSLHSTHLLLPVIPAGRALKSHPSLPCIFFLAGL